MPTFPKGHHAYTLRVENAKRLARLTPEQRQAHPDETRFEFPNPVDLRGIPAIGFGVAGHIPGTQPESAATR